MRIITISREFGSGGRELGKRLSDALGIPCYDHEIMEMVAEKHGFDQNHVASVSETDIRNLYPKTIAHRLFAPRHLEEPSVAITAAEHAIIRELAERGDCVIVGRCADITLREKNPMNLFVYAAPQARLERCRARAGADEHFTDREMLWRMRQIDRERATYRALFTEDEWGRKESYHLCINTTGKEIKKLIPAVAQYVTLWFEQE